MSALPLLNVAGAASNAAAAVASATQGDGNANPCALYLVFDVTLAGGASPTLQLVLEAFDPASQKFIAWGNAGFTALGGTGGTAVYVIALSTTMTTGGGVTAVVNLPVPALWRVRTVAGGTIGTASFTVAAYVNMNLQ